VLLGRKNDRDEDRGSEMKKTTGLNGKGPVGISDPFYPIRQPSPRASTAMLGEEMSDFCGEVEEPCLLVCHFYLPEKKTSIYVHLVLPEASLLPGTCPAEVYECTSIRTCATSLVSRSNTFSSAVRW
jgi:hypothetical protein